MQIAPARSTGEHQGNRILGVAIGPGVAVAFWQIFPGSTGHAGNVGEGVGGGTSVAVGAGNVVAQRTMQGLPETPHWITGAAVGGGVAVISGPSVGPYAAP